METKVCRICNRTKSIDSFHKSKAYASGRKSECKICSQQYIKQYRVTHGKTEPKEQRNMNLRLTATRPEDYCDMYKFLTGIGYDVHGDVHLQFCEKYGFTYTPRASLSKNKTSVEDCSKMKNPSE